MQIKNVQVAEVALRHELSLTDDTRLIQKTSALL